MPENIILMSRREDPFARVPKSLLNDERLSWKAKGIISYLIGKPSDWKTNVKDISARSIDGTTAIRSALNELRKVGYARLDKIQDANGKVVEWIWKISDSPIFLPDAGNPHLDNRGVDNRYLTKKEVTKNEFTKSKESKGTPPEDGDYDPVWKPSKLGRVAQLRKIKPPTDFPSQDEYNRFAAEEDLGNIQNHRPDLYRELCLCKWHQWKEKANRWVPIRDWKAYVRALDAKITDSTEN